MNENDIKTEFVPSEPIIDEVFPNEALREKEQLANARSLKSVCSHIGVSLLITLLASTVLSVLAQIIINFIDPSLIQSTAVQLAISSVAMYFIGFTLGFIYLKKLSPRTVDIPKKKKMKISHLIVSLIMCFGAMYSANLIGSTINTSISEALGSTSGDSVTTIVTSAPIWALAIFAVILAPIFEELFFRKVIIDRLAPYGEWMAIVLSSVLFGLFHCNLSQFFYATALGLIFGFLYLKTRKIIYTVILHAIINFSGSILPLLATGNIDIESYLSALESGDLNAMIEIIPTFIPVIIYSFAVVAFWIAGVILLISKRKQYSCSPAVLDLPAEKKASAIAFSAPGIILILAACAVFTVISIF